MHSYDLEGRGRIHASMAVLSVALAWLLDVGLNAASINPPWWLSAPSVAGCYSLLYWLFDRYIWRWGPLHKLGLLSVPDLNGRWDGEVDSSHGSEGTRANISVNILQRWSTILIILESDESISRSTMASFRTRDTDRPEVTYAYLSEPNNKAPRTMEIHRGTCALQVKANALEGGYYTGRGRGTVGEIKLERS